MTFPESTLIYGGHNYLEEYMETARNIEPDNKYIDDYLEKYNPSHVYSTLEEELKVNPSLRFNDEKMISILKSRDLPTETEYDRWSSIVRIV
jgi:hydroxyacylglutathione hydrolase